MKFSKYLLIVLMLFCSLAVTACDNKEEKCITVQIYGEQNVDLYSEDIQTNERYLINVMRQLDVSLEGEEGPYGFYILSLKGLQQKTEGNRMYYWAFYVNDQYSQVGVSSCTIEDGYIYKFVYEQYDL